MMGTPYEPVADLPTEPATPPPPTKPPTSTHGDLVTWLLAQFDREARDADLIPGGGYQPARWTAHRVPGNYVYGSLAEIREYGRPVGAPEDEQPEVTVAGYMAWGRNEDEHVVRWCPARVLREVETKRRIVAWCVEVIGDRDLSHYGEFGALAHDPQALAVTLAVETLRLLALPLADRPGYRQEWAP